MKFTGILLHFSSLCTDFGIGDLGPSAYCFADYLAENDYHYWQILPVTHCGYGDSPYNPISAFAFNPYLISPDLLYEQGLVSYDEVSAAKIPIAKKVNYPLVYEKKSILFAKATKSYLVNHDIDPYIQNNATYLKPYLCFLILSELYGSCSWNNWPTEHKTYNDQLFDLLWRSHSDRMKHHAVIQALFEEQFEFIVKYIHEKGIKLIGDLPLYLSYESAEVWAHQDLFELDILGKRKCVSGVPPDAFSNEGQLWGNPIYRWDRVKETDFEIFMNRYSHILRFIDKLRLDHFIGYVNYWQIECPRNEIPDSAVNGKWVKAPAEEFFSKLLHQFGKDAFIAEDLGILNEEVCKIRDDFGFPGMIVLQFCFEEGVPKISSFPKDRILYTGTHDNSTSLGWWESLPEDSPSRINLHRFCAQFPDSLGLHSGRSISEIMIMIAKLSGCETIIYPMQDVFGMNDCARMNTPGTALGNWQWRMTTKCLS